MRYMFLIYGDEAAIAAASVEESERSLAKNMAVLQEASEKEVLISVGALHPTNDSTTIRMKDESVITTDGPFAETKEQLGGYYILECRDLDEAIAWAAKMPACAGGCVEIRPMIEMPA